MSEMIERVALALITERYPSGVAASMRENGRVMLSPTMWTEAVAQARAAIAAMREPIPEMYDFGTDKMWKDRNSTEVWQAMIDGALS